MNMTQQHTVGFLVFDELQALDLFGPQETFASANGFTHSGDYYQLLVVSEKGAPVTTESGVCVMPHYSLHDCPPLDTLIIPGGAGTRIPEYVDPLLPWIHKQFHGLSRLGSVCSGLFILARTGLLDGKRVTTHWQFVDQAAQQFPQLHVEPDALYIREGKFFTAAGVTAGIDMALALIEGDLGPAIASKVARDLVVFLRRSGGQNQFSSLLQQQSQADQGFSE